MSETVAVALIAVAGTLGSGFLSYFAARRSTEVQLRGINAEMQRLRESHAEEHRRERQNAYYELIAAMDDVRQLCFGLQGQATMDSYREAQSKLGRTHTNVYFLGDEVVLDPLDDMVVIFREFTRHVFEADPSIPLHNQIQDSFKKVMESWNEGEAKLIEAMKADIATARETESRGS